MKKYLITEYLPRQSRGIDWEKCVGEIVPFKYGEVEGSFEIIKYIKNIKRIYFKYQGKEFDMNITNFLNCSVGVILGLMSREENVHFKYKVGDIINKNGYNLTVLDRKVIKKKKKDGYNSYVRMYKHKCDHCGKIRWKKELAINKYGCHSCSQSFNNLTSENSIINNAPWMIKYFQGGEKEASKYSIYSNQKIFPICPDCKRVKNKSKSINNIYKNRSIGCSCSDNISYPEKFMVSVLDQLGVDYIWQYSKGDAKWCDKYLYDFYIPALNMIIETDGCQHNSVGWVRTKEEQQEVDKIKKDLAYSNGVLNYMQINCYKSDMDYIKDNILGSNMRLYFNFENIDWLKADEFALSNFIKNACLFFENNKDNMLMKEIQESLKISNSTLVRYLKKGNKHGWCNYDSKYMHSIIHDKKKYKNCKHVKFIELNKVFLSASQIADLSEELVGVKLNKQKIQYVCNGTYMSHKGFHFEYVDSGG